MHESLGLLKCYCVSLFFLRMVMAYMPWNWQGLLGNFQATQPAPPRVDRGRYHEPWWPPWGTCGQRCDHGSWLGDEKFNIGDHGSLVIPSIICSEHLFLIFSSGLMLPLWKDVSFQHILAITDASSCLWGMYIRKKAMHKNNIHNPCEWMQHPIYWTLR